MKITKKQVKEAYDNVEKLKEWYPEAFEVTLEVGVWYKNNLKQLFNYQSIVEKRPQGYGFDVAKRWINYSLKDIGFNEKGIVKATPQEIETALIAEAKKRGYKDGNYECLVCKTYKHSDNYIYCIEGNILVSGWNDQISRNIIFKNGAWAEIIKPKQMTKDEIEKELGYNIEIV